jgi:eukaryotic-like serine/threonine-protein kinase
VIAPGEKLGRYHLREPLGSGGMSAVYRAYDPTLDREVAIKILPPEFAQDGTFRERFQEEARALGRVEHPNLVRIFAVGQEGLISFYAMELIAGRSLRRVLSVMERLSVAETVAVVGQVLNGLAAVHQAGIVHRDIKPGNILITKEGPVKLMDFGLAKASERITAVDVVMGTPSYMSPEQTRNSDVDARSDLYSLGLVLHEALTGKTVFAPGQGVLKRQQQETPKPPSKIVDGISKMLDDIVMKCVEKKPEDRYQTAEELLADLRKVTP